ncbi:carbohydrate ABC transporter permease [Kallipyga massiliensis]|uniref:carbohydrate ABC transporter permease n=2 Tax=Kallipyga massiliensis TaxID=1472764 RepID=UPI0004BA245A|nr:carbohydrate ABC transporter permease [Kallipyga massiliensis]
MDKKKISPSRIIIILLLVLFAASIIYPLFWMFMSSLKSYDEIYNATWSLPETWLWENYVKAWNGGVASYFVNSLIVTFATIVLVIFVGSMGAFALSKYKSRFIDLVFLLVTAGIMINPQVCLVPLFKMLNYFHLLDTKWSLILSYVAFRLPLVTLLLRSYFLSIPKEINESAVVDGCNEFQIYAHIYLPMSKPMLTTVTLLTAYYAWNEFLFGIIFISSDSQKTIPAGLMNFRDALQTDWGTLLAGMAIATLPMIILLIVFQKQLVRGISEGSVKG